MKILNEPVFPLKIWRRYYEIPNGQRVLATWEQPLAPGGDTGFMVYFVANTIFFCGLNCERKIIGNATMKIIE